MRLWPLDVLQLNKALVPPTLLFNGQKADHSALCSVEDDMRGIYFWPRLLLRASNRYRNILQAFVFLSVGFGYCFLLGSYALSRHREMVKSRNINTTKGPSTQNGAIPNTDTQTQKSNILFRSDHSMVILPMNSDSEDSGYDLEDLESELEGRRQRVWEVCMAHGLNTEGGYKEQYLRRSKKNPLVLARSHFPRPTIKQLQEALPESLSFLIVREPFERLLSAYRNKIEGLPHRFYRKMGREIVEKYRKKNSHANVLNPTSTGPTFSEFVNYITDKAGSTKMTKFDEHWAPYYSFCTPCHINFTVIAKLETLTRDQEYIIRRAGLENILMLPRHKDRPKMILNKARDGKNTNDLIRKYYGQLTEQQLKKLYDIYGIDFEMFGYNITKYYEIFKKDT
ncbi:uncharacterized protein LOC111869234 isoform X2 [Cryptotermes secundus]|uniref:uncharacterized protein LOC111869234 isoform X2 n=1 Tax=Cryptotermes secundus TaxID=105785 RepID=UPI000CD7AF01|nr:uncharacterized protein LOC111869234 isoform X2 [Cryptotermes secundus]